MQAIYSLVVQDDKLNVWVDSDEPGIEDRYGRCLCRYTGNPNFIEGSFSAVSKPIFQRKIRFAAFFQLYKIGTLLHWFKLAISSSSQVFFMISVIFL